jgi:hypothetical protein
MVSDREKFIERAYDLGGDYAVGYRLGAHFLVSVEKMHVRRFYSKDELGRGYRDGYLLRQPDPDGATPSNSLPGNDRLYPNIYLSEAAWAKLSSLNPDRLNALILSLPDDDSAVAIVSRETMSEPQS